MKTNISKTHLLEEAFVDYGKARLTDIEILTIILDGAREKAELLMEEAEYSMI